MAYRPANSRTARCWRCKARKPCKSCQEAAQLSFMDAAELEIAGIACVVTRSGYTGEDGFEIGCAAESADTLAETLLGRGAVPAGLGARDSLRLEAGLCLYGNDIDETTNPIEAGLGLGHRQAPPTDWDFPGAAADPRRAGERPGAKAASASGWRAAPPPAPAPSSAPRTARPSAASPPAASAPARAPRSPWAMCRADLAADGTSARSASCAASRSPPPSSATPFVPHRYVR